MTSKSFNLVNLSPDDLLGQSILDGLGFLDDYPRPSISITEQESGFFAACMETQSSAAVVEGIEPICEDVSLLNLIFESRKWVQTWMPINTTRRVIDLMIYVAIDFKNMLMAKKLLELFRKRNIAPTRLVSMSWLAVACSNCSIEACKLLLVSADYREEEFTRAVKIAIGQLALHAEPRSPAYAVMEFLLTHGADPNASQPPHRYDHGYLLHQAIFKRSLPSIEILLNYGAKLQQSGAIHAAAAADFVPALDLLYQHGADVNEMLKDRLRYKPDGSHLLSNTRECPLTYAVRCCSKAAVEWLLEHGANSSLFVATSSMRLKKDRRKIKLAERIWGFEECTEEYTEELKDGSSGEESMEVEYLEVEEKDTTVTNSSETVYTSEEDFSFESENSALDDYDDDSEMDIELEEDEAEAETEIWDARNDCTSHLDLENTVKAWEGETGKEHDIETGQMKDDYKQLTLFECWDSLKTSRRLQSRSEEKRIGNTM